jgi:uncharacterized membrane protein YwaF
MYIFDVLLILGIYGLICYALGRFLGTNDE